MVISKYQIEVLEEELIEAKRSKRQKVQEDSNQKFITIHMIRNAQIEAGRVEMEDLASETNSEGSIAESCIEIGGSDVDNSN